ncbi:hypothetical protein GCM10017687_45910 [Streptomyces echinatus]
MLRHTLTAFLLRLAHLAASSAPASRQQTDSTFTRYRDAVERGFATNHSVSAYADALGYSRRTLVRAVRAATGGTPKGFIDRRVVLEAKRLLAHTDLTIGRVGAAVGFPDAANFSKFFHLHTGRSRWPSGRNCADRPGRRAVRPPVRGAGCGVRGAGRGVRSRVPVRRRPGRSRSSPRPWGRPRRRVVGGAGGRGRPRRAGRRRRPVRAQCPKSNQFTFTKSAGWPLVKVR